MIQTAILLLIHLLMVTTAVVAQRSPAQYRNYSTNTLWNVLKNYDKYEPPSINSTTMVKVGFYVNSFSIDTLRMEYSLTMYFKQMWQDKRLAFNCDSQDTKCNRIGGVRLHENFYTNIWTPDTFFRNEKHSSFHMITVPNKGVNLKNDGSVYYVTRLSATLTCPMMLQNFPMDTQRCPFFVESFRYTWDTMHYNFLSFSSIQFFDDAIHLGEFQFLHTDQEDCSMNYTSGLYPCLKFDMIFKRNIGYYLKKAYIPCFFMVIISWMPFWLAAEGAYRVMIGFFSFLITMFINNTVATGLLPKINYITALEFWIGSCQAFIVLSLLETAVILVLYQRASKNSNFGDGREKKSDEIANKVDCFARIGFSSVFLLFTAFYTIYYTA